MAGLTTNRKEKVNHEKKKELRKFYSSTFDLFITTWENNVSNLFATVSNPYPLLLKSS